MNSSVQIFVPSMVGSFSYEIICEKQRTGNRVSNTNCFMVELKQGFFYQIKINEFLTSIFKVTKKTKKIVIGPHTTIATIFCFSRLLNSSVEISNYCNIRLSTAESIRRNLVKKDKVSCILKKGPNGMETNTWMLFNFLSNLLLSQDSRILDITSQNTFLEAFLYISRNPFSYIPEIFSIGNSLPQKYLPTITSVEQIGQLTLSIKVNTTGDINYLPGGPGAMTLDKCQNIWVSLNVVQGTDGSNTWAMVLDKGARPKCFSPVFPVLGAGYGITYDKYRDNVLFGSFGWGKNVDAYNPFEGSITVFDAKDGTNTARYNQNLHRVQGITVDNYKNIWMCSWGSNDSLGSVGGLSPPTASTGFPSEIVVFVNGDPKNTVIYPIDYAGSSPYYGPFDITVDSFNNVFVTIGGYSSDSLTIKSAVLKLRYNCEKKEIVKIGEYIASDYFFYKGIAIDSNNNVIVASFEEDKVLLFDNNLSLISEYKDEFSGPWGIAVDSCDNIWVSNFFAFNNLTKGLYVTKLRNCEGDLSFSGKFVLRSGGDPVTLQTGETLKNPDGTEIFEPLMRQTYSLVDSAGNLYVTNNWKPSLFEDIFREGGSPNPGGDGIVIFIGVACPRKLNTKF